MKSGDAVKVTVGAAGAAGGGAGLGGTAATFFWQAPITTVNAATVKIKANFRRELLSVLLSIRFLLNGTPCLNRDPV
jgi:hypothetical protein